MFTTYQYLGGIWSNFSKNIGQIKHFLTMMALIRESLKLFQCVVWWTWMSEWKSSHSYWNISLCIKHFVPTHLLEVDIFIIFPLGTMNACTKHWHPWSRATRVAKKPLYRNNEPYFGLLLPVSLSHFLSRIHQTLLTRQSYETRTFNNPWNCSVRLPALLRERNYS